jgi:capsular polysaccharide transport system permease protein
MIPFSGLFYMVSWVTPAAREFLLFSPFVNGMEMMRKGVWGDDVTAYYNIWNPIICSTIATMIGFILCRRVRRKFNVE